MTRFVQLLWARLAHLQLWKLLPPLLAAFPALFVAKIAFSWIDPAQTPGYQRRSRFRYQHINGGQISLWFEL